MATCDKSQSLYGSCAKDRLKCLFKHVMLGLLIVFSASLQLFSNLHAKLNSTILLNYFPNSLFPSSMHESTFNHASQIQKICLSWNILEKYMKYILLPS